MFFFGGALTAHSERLSRIMLWISMTLMLMNRVAADFHRNLQKHVVEFVVVLFESQDCHNQEQACVQTNGLRTMRGALPNNLVTLK